MHIYEIRPRKDGRGFDLISDVNNKTTPAQLKSGRSLPSGEIEGLVPHHIILGALVAEYAHVRGAQARLDNFQDGKR